MVLASSFTRILSAIVGRAAQGEPRAGPWNLPISGGMLTPDAPGWGNYYNWWQLGGNIVSRSSQSAMVEACVSAYAQTVAMCPGGHFIKLENGGRERVTTSALSRILRRPNEYQSISDFMLNATRSLFLDGNTYALALRNNRFEIDELHLMNPNRSSPQVATSTGEVFYQLDGNDIISQRLAVLPGELRSEQLLVPARDVLHIRLHCYERARWPFPLVGETPLTAAYGDIAYYEKMKNQQENFLQNRASPSAVIQTDLNLDKPQIEALRDRWNEQAKGLHSGGVPILSHGLKVMPWPAPAAPKDMQLAEMLKLVDEHIALAFRVPLAILGIVRGSGTSTEDLYRQWLASGLGFCINHIETAFDDLFNLEGQPDEYTEFSTEVLLRSAQKERIDMLVRGVQGGIYSPNEARAMEDMPAVEFGDEPRLQAQVVPLSAAASVSSVPSAPAQAAPPGGPVGVPAVAAPAPQRESIAAAKSVSASTHLRLINREAARHDRRRSA